MEETPMSREEAMIQFNKLEKQAHLWGVLIMSEFRDNKKQDGSVVAYQDQDKGALETNMTKEEERTIIGWMESDASFKESSKLEDENMPKMTEQLSNGLAYVQRRLFKAMLGGESSFDMSQCSTASWVPWKLLLQWIQREDVWGDSIAEKQLWNMFMATLNKDNGYHSYMVKYWQDAKMAVIKLTPKGGMGGKWQTGLKRSYETFKGQKTASK
eukprot:15576654-Heterocapsa_arctica.AAC.1